MSVVAAYIYKHGVRTREVSLDSSCLFSAHPGAE